MTEPVAYMWKTVQGTIIALAPNDNSHSGGRLGIPLYTAEQLHPRVKMTQAEFDELEISLINAQFDYSELKKTIEVVAIKKWFVRSKKAVGENNFYAWLFNNDFLDVPAHMISDEIPPLAMKFDTKEQAELWTNPLTEAVQLPVEDE